MISITVEPPTNIVDPRRAVTSTFLYDDQRIIGNGRILSDGVCNAYIVDVWTDSAYRRRGIATKIVRLLQESVRGQHIYLQTDDATELYEKSGFRPQPHGMGCVVGSWLGR
jgi:predicted GNAT family acetyltransferase